MSKFIVLEDIFDNDSLYVVKDYAGEILATASLKSWVNAENYTIDGAGNLVLLDKSQVGANFSLPSSRTTGPTIVESVLNGLSVIQFNGGGGDTTVGGLQRAVSDIPTDSGVFTFVCVYRITEGSGVHNVMATASASSGVTMYSLTTGESRFAGGSVDSNFGQLIPIGQWGIHVGVVDFDNMSLKYLNPASLDSVASRVMSTVNSSNKLYLGENGNPTSFMNGQIAEALCFYEDILESPETLDTILTYIKVKFGL